MKATRRSALALVALGLLAFASPAAAADRIYFGGNSSVSYANLDGSGGATLDTSGATTAEVRGIAIDPAAGKIYWAGSSGAGSRISVANIEGGGAKDLQIEGVTLKSPRGIAIDSAAGRLYWANYQGAPGEGIAFFDLDGSDRGYLDTTGATVANPKAVALDLTARRIYWSNENGKISYASLNGSGGEDVTTTGATSGVTASGVAIDPGANRIHWASNKGAIPYEAFISSAGLGGGGGADLATTVDDGSFPWGVAIDPSAGRIYWANTGAFGSFPPSIQSAPLAGGSAPKLNLTGAKTFGANNPALLKAPVGTEAPELTAGIAARPRFLICDKGKWAGDRPEAQLYRAPHSVSYQWVEDGQPVAGATRSDIGVDGRPGGDYACQVTATNAAGSTTQMSRVQFVCCPVTPKAKAARVALVKGGRAQLKLTCPAGVEPCAGRLHLESSRPPRRTARSSARRGPKIPNLPVIYGERSISIPGGDQQVVKVKLNRRAKSQLRKSKRHRLRALLDGRAVVSRTVLLKLAPKPRRGQ